VSKTLERLPDDEAFQLWYYRSLHFVGECPANLTEREQLGWLRAEFYRVLEAMRAAQPTHPLPGWDDPWAEYEYRSRIAGSPTSVSRPPNPLWDTWTVDDIIHSKLTPEEQACADELRDNYSENGVTVDDGEPIYGGPGDCGKFHLSDLASAACANAIQDADDRARAARRAGRPAPTVASSVPSRTPPTQVTSSRRAVILETVRSAPASISANAIAAAIGGRKAAVLAEVRALVQGGVLVATKGGFMGCWPPPRKNLR
jgi:hypothetical protein